MNLTIKTTILAAVASLSLLACSHSDPKPDPATMPTKDDVALTAKQDANQTFYDRAGAPQQCAPPKDTAGAPEMCKPREADDYFVKACKSGGFTMVTCGGCVNLCTGKPANP